MLERRDRLGEFEVDAAEKVFVRAQARRMYATGLPRTLIPTR